MALWEIQQDTQESGRRKKNDTTLSTKLYLVHRYYYVAECTFQLYYIVLYIMFKKTTNSSTGKCYLVPNTRAPFCFSPSNTHAHFPHTYKKVANSCTLVGAISHMVVFVVTQRGRGIKKSRAGDEEGGNRHVEKRVTANQTTATVATATRRKEEQEESFHVASYGQSLWGEGREKLCTSKSSLGGRGCKSLFFFIGWRGRGWLDDASLSVCSLSCLVVGDGE